MREDYREGIPAFVTESNYIEGIERDPTEEEIVATAWFLTLPEITVGALCKLAFVYAGAKGVLRDRPGMNVKVYTYYPPAGGAQIRDALAKVLHISDPWQQHCSYELLHPFLDGNGRTGRALWAWTMTKQGVDPFRLKFLHRFYYQTLQNQQVRG